MAHLKWAWMGYTDVDDIRIWVTQSWWQFLTEEISWRYGLFRTNTVKSVTNIEKKSKICYQYRYSPVDFLHLYFGRFSFMILIKDMTFWQFFSVLIKLSIFNRWLSGIVRYIAIISLNKLILFDRWRKRE